MQDPPQARLGQETAVADAKPPGSGLPGGAWRFAVAQGRQPPDPESVSAVVASVLTVPSDPVSEAMVLSHCVKGASVT